MTLPNTVSLATEPRLAAALAEAATGRALSDGEAWALAGADDDGLAAMLDAAGQMRDLGKGRTVTFSPKVFIPLTHLCRDFCGYCIFRKTPEQAGKEAQGGSLYMTPEQVLEVANAGRRLGCAEALFTLGERPEQRYPEAKDWLAKRGFRTTLEYLADVNRLVLEETGLLPHANPGTMSRREMAALQPYNPSMGLMLESTSPALHAPGGPHEFAPSKRPRVRLRTIELAGQLRLPFTTGILIGIGDTRHDRIESLLAIRELHRRFGHIQEVIVQNFRAKPGTAMAGKLDADTIELLWSVAAARLILGPEANVQVPPNLSADHYRIYLEAGINDWGGVSPLTIDFVNPEAPWPALTQLKAQTEAAGFRLMPRLPVYPEYFIDTGDYLTEELRVKARAMADDDGYVRGGIQRYVGKN